MNPFSEKLTQKEKLSQKEIDVFSRNLLKENSSLKNEIIHTLNVLQEKDLPMPLIHITSRAVLVDNKEISTNFIENITNNGFRKRDTNIATFINRGSKSSIASPEDCAKDPENFIKSIRLFLERYLHHGLRTNKDALQKLKGAKKSLPVILLIDGNCETEHGSDYDDHFILKNGADPQKIIGIIEIAGDTKPHSKEDITCIAKKFLNKINLHYNKNHARVA